MSEQHEDINGHARKHKLDSARTKFDHGREKADGNNGENADGENSDSAGGVWPDLDQSLISDDRPPAPDFDWDAVPPAWVYWIRDTAAECGAPVDYVFAALIAVASAVIGNVMRVSPGIGWIEQAHLWFALVGIPSSNKTPALGPYKTVCNELESGEQVAHDEAMQRYAEQKERADAVREKWKKAVKDAAERGDDSTPIPGEAREPDKPVPPRIMIADSSTEQVGALLAGNPRGLVLVRSELAGWLGQFDRYGGKGVDRAFYLEAWDGGSHVIDRVKLGTPLRVPYVSLSIVGNLQPDHLREMFTGVDDGLAARFIYVWPEPIPPQPLRQSAGHDHAKQLRKAFTRLRGLDWARDGQGNPVPAVLHLEAAAQDVLQAVRQEVYQANNADGSGVIAGWRGKNPGRLLRLALVFELLEWSPGKDHDPPESVSLDSVKRAANYLDYSTAMMERCIAGLALTEAQRDAASLARYLVRSGRKNLIPAGGRHPVLNERQVYQTAGFHALRDKERRTLAFRDLQATGWVQPAPAKGEGRRKGDWLINPSIWKDC